MQQPIELGTQQLESVAVREITHKIKSIEHFIHLFGNKRQLTRQVPSPTEKNDLNEVRLSSSERRKVSRAARRCQQPPRASQNAKFFNRALLAGYKTSTAADLLGN